MELQKFGKNNNKTIWEQSQMSMIKKDRYLQNKQELIDDRRLK